MKALQEGDHRHAIYMYKVAASWGYKAAEYDLGLIYYRGEHVPANRPLGTAWMVLAAQRGKSPLYSRARDLMVTSLTEAQLKRMHALRDTLKKAYGDKVALPRLRLFTGWVAAQDNIGSHLADGFGGEVLVGKVGPGGALAWLPQAAAESAPSNAWLWQKNASPPVARTLKCPTGTVKVEPLQQIKTNDAAKPHQPDSSGRPPGSA